MLLCVFLVLPAAGQVFYKIVEGMFSKSNPSASFCIVSIFTLFR